MSVRKLLTGLVAVAGVLAFAADANAFGKRKKNRGGCDDYSHAAPVYTGGCGGCGTAYYGGPGGYAMAAPEAMPATGTATTTQPGAVVPATGTTGGTIVPATGTVVPQSSVNPAGGYYLQNGQYVMPAGNTTFEGGFRSGVIQGALGTPNYYQYGNTVPGAYGNNLGRQVGRGIFRR